MPNFIRTSLVILCGFAISSCSVQTGPSTTYRVDAVPALTARHAHHNITLLVTPPLSGPLYGSSEMAYSKERYEIGYFVKNSWAEAPSQMLQPLIVQTLQDTHAFHSVNSSQAMGSYDYVVNTQILKFEQDFSHPQSVFRLELRVQLLNAASNRVISTRNIAVVEPAPANTPYGGVIAANKATSHALAEIRHFCLRRL